MSRIGQALNAGADLYLIKPVNFSDLAESIQALAPGFASKNRRNASTRRHQQSGQRRLTGYSRTSTCGAVWAGLPLTQQEYRLLEVLMRNRNEVCSKVDLHTSLFTDEGERNCTESTS